MKCIYCSHDDSHVVDSRPAENGMAIRRRRECLNCGKRFTTYERIDEMPFVVVKNDGARQAFSREKIAAGIKKACEKRPISIVEQNMVVDNIVRELFNTVEDSEIPSKVIGELVMQHLKLLDDVAYVRFASVYRKFCDIDTFLKELNSLREDKEAASSKNDRSNE